MVREICNALMESDVNIKLVSGLRKSIKGSVKFKDIAPGVNKKRLIQKVDETTPFDSPSANTVRLSLMSW
jgi:signal recognition particle subunit SRP54